MIVGVYGVCTLTPSELCSVIDKLGTTYAYVNGKQFNRVVKKTDGLVPVVFMSAREFLVSSKKIKFKAMALIVDNPIILARELKIPLLDALISDTAIQTLNFEVSSLIDAAKSCQSRDVAVAVNRKVYNPAEVLIQKYKSSDLAKLQTALYRVKDRALRDKLGAEVKKWLTTRASVHVLEQKLAMMCTQNIVSQLMTVVKTDNIETLRKAIRTAKENPTRIDSVAKKYKINAFDIRYLLTK